MAVQTQILHRRDTAANWTSVNPTLGAGEIGFETDTGKFKIGTGSATWTSLTYATDASGITGTLGVANGGTGKTSVTTGSLLVGAGTSAMTEVAVTTTGEANKIVKTDAAGAINGSDIIVTSGNRLQIKNTSGYANNLYANNSISGFYQNYTMPQVGGTLIGSSDNGTVTSTMILDGTIVNADISASAAISDTKLAQITTANKVNVSAITGTLPVANGGTGVTTALVSSDGSGITMFNDLDSNTASLTTTATLTNIFPSGSSTVTLEANSTYSFSFFATLTRTTTTASTASVRFTTSPTVSIFKATVHGYNPASLAISTVQTSEASMVVTPSSTTANVEYGVFIQGFLTTSGSSTTLTPQFSQSANGGFRVNAGSNIQLTKLNTRLGAWS